MKSREDLINSFLVSHLNLNLHLRTDLWTDLRAFLKSDRDPSRHSSVKRDPDPDQLTRDSTNKRHCSSTLISQSIDTFTDSSE